MPHPGSSNECQLLDWKIRTTAELCFPFNGWISTGTGLGLDYWKLPLLRLSMTVPTENQGMPTSTELNLTSLTTT